ncbi:DNA mismatch repair protein Msh3-like [Oratosquilla oratoria]|uniref:DNA mismatch repair protein Msh3-like n=1 Tax=Oratosquilla oratoria TaxID=337810 RepID=UPI003F770F15
MPGHSQPTISHFFAPLSSKKANVRTDADCSDAPAKKKAKKNEVSTAPFMKRASKEPSSPSSKKAKIDSLSKDGDAANNNGHSACESTPRELAESTRNKLESFVYNEDKPPQDESQEMPERLKPSPTKTTTAKMELSIFRSASHDKSAVSAEPKEDKGHPLKANPRLKLTPLEQQVVLIKEQYPNALLFVECGYKYRFFGEDAEIAARELNIIAHLDHNFMTASIPTHRLHVHVRRLVAKGYKVGVVKQKETAALKAAGSNKNAPFMRELSELYTRSTLIGEDVTPTGPNSLGVSEGDVTEGITSTLLTIFEGKSFSKKEGTVGIGLLAIQPSTGDMVYDSFDDTATRSELWSRLEHIQPVETLVSSSISNESANTIKSMTVRSEDCIRMEQLDEDKFDYSGALQNVCHLFMGDDDRVRHISSLPAMVVSCIGATIHYLSEFRLDRIIKTAGTIQPYSMKKKYMHLPAPTIRNLEVLTNSDTFTEKGSLLWAVNKTSTKFGGRQLRKWITQPLLDVDIIRDRQDMVEELMTSDSPVIAAAKKCLEKLPDVEKALTTIFYKKCSTYDFWLTTKTLSQIHYELSKVGGNLEDCIKTKSLVELIESILSGLANVAPFMDNLDPVSAKDGKKTTLFCDVSMYPDVLKRKQEIKAVEDALNGLRSEIARTLRLPAFVYTSVSGLEYLIEVKNAQLKAVPKDWSKLSSTKACARFRSPAVEKLFTRLQQLRELLQADCQQAWITLLDEFSKSYQEHRQAVLCLATLDALNSLACIAQSHGYCRPVVEEEGGILQITGGKHPVVSQLKTGDEQFVANDTNMEVSGKRVMLVTGPNMGGKSCYMRQVALLALMAQVGSFVPAESMHLSVLDGIYTRMGASDEIYSGRSTFMVEVGETSDIMKQATNKSLVILDELGRGTSTHDGVAIAMGTLEYFLKETKCLTIFVTHYFPLTDFEKYYPEHVGNYHMSFIVSEEESQAHDIDVVTFLYQLTEGSAGQSYGLNVARLANLPHSVLVRAASMSKDLKRKVDVRRKGIPILKQLITSKDNMRELLMELKECI